MFRHVTLLVVLSVALAAVVGFVLWLLLAQPDLSTTAVPATGPRPLTAAERLDSLKLALAVVAGIGGIVALTVAYRKQRQGRRPSGARRRNATPGHPTAAVQDRWARSAVRTAVTSGRGDGRRRTAAVMRLLTGGSSGRVATR
jgi:hypothetical protein